MDNFSQKNISNLNSPPEKIKFLKDLTIDSYSDHCTVYKFDIFLSTNSILYLIYSNKNCLIILYDLLYNKKISEIKNAHSDYITGLRHYVDKINKKDYFISICFNENNLRLWNLYNYECLLNLKMDKNSARLNSACFLNDKGK